MKTDLKRVTDNINGEQTNKQTKMYS